jgi:SAM-dependent methyltransferase
MKLTKAQAKAHERACALLDKSKLNFDERIQVLRDWRAGASPINSLTGAHFTPFGIARDLLIETCEGRMADFCAGTGRLAFHAFMKANCRLEHELVCIELNPEYVAVGRKILPEATWLCADIFNLPDIGHFTCAISNPPYGAARRSGRAPRYKGRSFEYHVLDIASDHADHGVFLIPQQSAPFRYSGQQSFEMLAPEETPDYTEFFTLTGIELEANCGLDTTCVTEDEEGWDDVSVTT